MKICCIQVQRYFVRFSVVLLLGVAASSPARADDNPDSADFPVVLTASRMLQPLSEAPAAVTVIDRETIEHSGVRQIADLLRLVPGAVVGYNDGNWPVATLRGMSATYASGLQVLVDGVSFYSPLFGGMEWGNLPLSVEDIDRIEVVRGPNAAIYGANSFLGVVNIITRDPALELGTQISSNFGNDGVRDIAFHHSAQADGWRYRISGGHRADEGFTTRPDSAGVAHVDLRTAYQINAVDSMQLTWRAGNIRKEIGVYGDNKSSRTPHTQFGQNQDLQLRWTRAESSDQETWVQYYHQQNGLRDRVDIDARNFFLSKFTLPQLLFLGVPMGAPIPYQIEIDYTTSRDGLELQNTNRWSDRLRTVVGVETRRDAANSARFFATNEDMTAFMTRGYVNAEWHFADQWTLHPGVMYEHNSIAESGWSPKMAVTYSMFPGHILRASISKAYRTPTLVDKFAKYAFTVPLPAPFNTLPILTSKGNVNSEEVISRELGYVFDGLGDDFSLDGRVFSDRYKSLIAQVAGDTVNLDNAHLSGIDLSLRWRATQSTHIRFTASRSNIHSSDLDSFYSASVPVSTTSVFIDQELGQGVLLTANYQRVSSMYWTDAGAANHEPNTIPAIDHLNLRLAKQFNANDSRLEVAVVMQNALGHYHDYYPANVPSQPLNLAQRITFLQLKSDF